MQLFASNAVFLLLRKTQVRTSVQFRLEEGHCETMITRTIRKVILHEQYIHFPIDPLPLPSARTKAVSATAV